MPPVCLRSLVLLAGFLVGLGGQTGAPLAHPHIWITDVTTFVFEQRHLVGLHHRWEFDELFSAYIVEEHDVDGNREFDERETAALFEQAFSSLEEFDYFTHVRIAGDKLPLHEVADFRASIADEVLIYEFTLPLPEPVDPSRAEFAAGIYDPEYYVEVLLDQDDPVRFHGLSGESCTFAIGEDTDNPIYYGMIYPLTITLACATS